VLSCVFGRQKSLLELDKIQIPKSVNPTSIFKISVNFTGD